MSDHKGPRLVLGALPPAAHLIADRAYDSALFRDCEAGRVVEHCPDGHSRICPVGLALDWVVLHLSDRVKDG